MHASKAEYSFPKVLSGDTLSFGKDRVSVLFVQFGFLHILGGGIKDRLHGIHRQDLLIFRICYSFIFSRFIDKVV